MIGKTEQEIKITTSSPTSAVPHFLLNLLMKLIKIIIQFLFKIVVIMDNIDLVIEKISASVSGTSFIILRGRFKTPDSYTNMGLERSSQY